MTEQEYLQKKEELDKQFNVIYSKMDELGFTPYQDGAGDFGKRRFIKDKTAWEVWVMDMVGEENPYLPEVHYPDGQFLGVAKENINKWIRSVEDLVKWISDEANFAYKITG